MQYCNVIICDVSVELLFEFDLILLLAMQQSGAAFDCAGADGDFAEAKGCIEGGLQEY